MDNSPFHDSTLLICDGDALLHRLNEDGYLFIRGLIPRADITKVRQRLLQTLSSAGWLAPDTDLHEGVISTAADSSTLKSTGAAVLSKLWCDEELHRLRTHKNVLTLFETIFKQTVLAHPNFFLRAFLPNESATDSHQDKIFVGGANFYTMWTPLSDYPIAQGVLTLAGGSHLAGIRQAKFGGMGILDELAGTWLTNSFNAGDVLIFTNLTVHKSMPNLTNNIRLSFDARYQPAGLPVADVNLTPAKDSGQTTWDAVYANWQSKADQYYWQNFDLEIIELERKYYERDYPIAFARAKNGDVAIQESLLRLI